MTEKEELTYYEYWLTKEEWTAHWAIRLVTDYIKVKRSWEAYEDDNDVVSTIYNDLKSRMNEDGASHIYGRRNILHDIDRFDNNRWVPRELDMDESKVWPDRFIKYIYDKGYQIPYEFKAFIGLDEKEDALNEKQQQKHDKAACQGIARTLWSIYPEMKIEEMQYHKAIQVYGSGKLYSTDTTLRRWLSEVDPRSVKTGPKKKL